MVMTANNLKKRLTTPSLFEHGRLDSFNMEFTRKYAEPKYYISTNDKSVDTNGRLLKLKEIDENASKLLINVETIFIFNIIDS
jgi:hypothetical protein